MNRLTPQKAALYDLTHALRTQVLGALTDDDLTFNMGGETLTLHRLLSEQGEIQAAYTRLFQGEALRFDCTAPAGLDTVAELRAWFAALDAELWAALETLSNDDLDRPTVRGGHTLPLGTVFYTYRESVFIFTAKASVYLRALGRTLPAQVRSFVG